MTRYPLRDSHKDIRFHSAYLNKLCPSVPPFLQRLCFSLQNLCFSLCFKSLCVTRYALCARAELEFDATGPRKRGRFRLHTLRLSSPFTVHCSLNPLFLKNLCPSVPLFLKNLSAFLCKNLCFSLCFRSLCVTRYALCARA